MWPHVGRVMDGCLRISLFLSNATCIKFLVLFSVSSYFLSILTISAPTTTAVPTAAAGESQHHSLNYYSPSVSKAAASSSSSSLNLNLVNDIRSSSRSSNSSSVNSSRSSSNYSKPIYVVNSYSYFDQNVTGNNNNNTRRSSVQNHHSKHQQRVPFSSFGLSALGSGGISTTTGGGGDSGSIVSPVVPIPATPNASPPPDDIVRPSIVTGTGRTDRGGSGSDDGSSSSSVLFLPSYYEYNGNNSLAKAIEAEPTSGSSGPAASSSSSLSSSLRKLNEQFGVSTVPETINYQSPWTWSCFDGVTCKRQLRNVTTTGTNTVDEAQAMTLDVCWLTCGTYGPLWPLPTIKTILTKSVTPFYPQNVEITNIFAPNNVVKAMLGFAGNALLGNLFRMLPKSEASSAFPKTSDGKRIKYNIVTISLTAQSSDTKLGLTTDESYSLTIAPYYEGQGQRLHVEINGATFFGVRHGLETLSQLIAYDEIHSCLQIVSQVIIHDRPAFPYRGLLIDTARNFIPMSHLRRMVDAMAQNKLNMLHWHLTDTNSFPFYSKSVPQMTKYGAYSKSQIYTPNDIKEFVMYARLKGVKVIPELDAPAHAGNGWQWGPLEGLGELAMCINAEPWRNFCGQPPCGQLNPLNRFTYIILGEIYKDMLEVFDRDLFHMGGDEIYFQCWSMDGAIQNWQRNHSNYDLMHLWGFFQDSAYDKLKDANNGNPITPIVWTSDMTNRGRHFLNPDDYIIQVWSTSTSHDIKELLHDKYRLIFSNLESLYLDHGFGSWLGKEHFYQFKTWQELYDNDLKKIIEHHMGSGQSDEIFRRGQILGGEATLWTEKVDMHNMEMKLWPRSSAFAERMWTHPAKRTDSVHARLLHHRQRMVSRGIQADRLQPESCHQLHGNCHDPHSIL